MIDEIASLVKLKQESQKLYLVGGVVRDLQFAKSHKDIDILCNFDTRTIAKEFADVNHGAFFMLDNQRNIARVIVTRSEGKKVYDFARLRNADIIADMRARDFTINAMAIDLEEPEVILDPLNGRDDFQRGLLRDCSENSFSSDPVRVIRAVRYSIAYGLKIEEGTLKRLKLSVNLLNQVSGERKRDEFFKVAESTKPDEGFRLLGQLNILEELGFPVDYKYEEAVKRMTLLQELLKTLTSQNRVENPINHSQVTLAESTRRKINEYLRARNSSDRNELQLLFLGCALCYIDVDDAKKAASLQMLSRDEIEKLLLISTSKLLNEIIETGSIPDDRAMYQYYKATGAAGVDLAMITLVDLMNTGLGESANKQRFIWELCEKVIAFWFEKPEVANPVLLLNGKDLMVNFDLTPGPLIGDLISRLREEQAAGMIKDRRAALDWVENQLSKVSIKNTFD
jgi:tRNA nucleotidyltransferase/poly(A) polymerase